MTLARVTTWSVGQVLTSTALNNEFDNILNNPTSLINAMPGATGDLWRASGTNTWGRLVIGSTNDFLQVVAGVPAWVEAPTVTLGTIGATSTDGLTLEPSLNGTTWSPRLRWRAWTGASVIEDWWAEAQPQAASAGAWVLSSRENLGATVARLTVDITNSRLNIPAGWVYAINGTQIAATDLSGLGAGVATFLATPSSANLAAAVTGETGSGALVFGTSPTLVTPTLGSATATTMAVTGSTGSTFTSTLVHQFAVGYALAVSWGAGATTRGFHRFARIENDGGNQVNVDIDDDAGGKPRLLLDTHYIEGTEITAPAAPAANGGRIYFQDNGAGKTQLMVIFSSGAAQQIAIQP